MSAPGTAVVAGASGYIGQHLTGSLASHGWTIRTIGRAPHDDATWAAPRQMTRVLEGADLLVNLAGRSVSCRYNKTNADAIFSSRVETTAALGQALARTDNGPELWINASTGTIYRDARDRPMNEETGDIGTGFSVAVARAWEHELFTAPSPIRKVALRMSIVLGAGEGAINPILNLARMGLGGRMGEGAQMFSWVHIDDVIRAVEHVRDHPEISGPVNVATPHPVTNAQFMAETRKAVGRLGVPTPAWLLEAGARLIRTEAELVLKSRWVEPRRLTDTDFAFQHPTLPEALADIVAKSPRTLLPVTRG